MAPATIRRRRLLKIETSSLCGSTPPARLSPKARVLTDLYQGSHSTEGEIEESPAMPTREGTRAPGLQHGFYSRFGLKQIDGMFTAREMREHGMSGDVSKSCPL